MDTLFNQEKIQEAYVATKEREAQAKGTKGSIYHYCNKRSEQHV